MRGYLEMKTIRSNKRVVFYRKYLGKRPIVDDDGYETGEYKVKYGKLKKAWVNVTAGRGQKYVREYGGSEEYDRKLVVKDTPLEPNDVMWIDSLNVLAPYDYLVVDRARGLNNSTILVRKVRVSDGS